MFVTTRKPFFRLRAVSLFSWSVEQNVQNTQMTTRVTEGARRERHDNLFSGCRPRFSSRVLRLRRSTLARACTPLLNLKKKRDCSQSSPFLATRYSVNT